MNATPSRIRIALVFGGRSSEHTVSCVTAGGVLSALDPARYEVIPIGITTEGRWVLSSGKPEQLAIAEGQLPEVSDEGGSVVLSERSSLIVQSPGEVPEELGTVDVVFPLLHGPFGEDGTIQGLFELAGVRYVGSGVLASAAGMDKHVMKLLLQAAGLPVVPHVLVGPGAWDRQRDQVLADVERLGWPVFVKPARAGSSMGVSKVDGPDGLESAVLSAREHDPKVMVEEAVEGREIECGVLEGVDGGEPEASVVGEIRFDASHDFYDFQAKYLPDDGVALDLPADIPPETAEQVRHMAVTAFQALSCESLARVDFFLRPDGSVLVNEVNTMPGFTPTSMFPMLWAKSGIDYPALVDRMISTALGRPLGLR
ncbi:D-alanine--D-alanine ligase [Actinobacteria bacterium YIM 96077]|uniref:D-alanine--D-alanine ligase n=1 Tax=Phytoactinopolyspora halophila TaxID=1981511 RepID=A0A329QFY9_9ACTN|nr:D-alanine--D-alanine ligase family protein [Phytoactinopolyspora halophila]AYY12695.1 D-alanine--D-alanine ligase [Actinobacteria bacterium YIM 96077]RAW10609.1 D-alanine--D-alanine ligase A [Phytoactinopolyspora halophila]